MLKFFIDRVFQGIIVLLAVSFLAFLMFRFLGDPILAIAGADSTAEQRAAIRESLGLDAPLLLQYLDYLRNIVTGQFGISYRLGEPVTRVILDRAPATIELEWGPSPAPSPPSQPGTYAMEEESEAVQQVRGGLKGSALRLAALSPRFAALPYATVTASAAMLGML